MSMEWGIVYRMSKMVLKDPQWNLPAVACSCLTKGARGPDMLKIHFEAVEDLVGSYHIGAG